MKRMEITIKVTPEEVKELFHDLEDSEKQAEIPIHIDGTEVGKLSIPKKEKTIQQEKDSLKGISASNIDAGGIIHFISELRNGTWTPDGIFTAR